MPVLSPRDLFLHELSDMYSAEEHIKKMLPQMASETKDPQVRSGFEMHEKQTADQIKNLDQCFKLLGMKRDETVKCHAVEGLKKEHDEFLKQRPPESMVTMFDLGAGLKTEHYEIASYEGLVEKARLMAQNDVANLLEDNLRQEKEMAQKITQLARQLGEQQIVQIRPDTQSQLQTQTQTQL